MQAKRCWRCGAQRAPLGPMGACVNLEACRARRYQKKADDERRAGQPQCLATLIVGETRKTRDVRLCVRGRGHDGAHFSGSVVWQVDDGDPIGETLRRGIGGR